MNVTIRNLKIPTISEKEMKELIETEVMGKIKIGGLEKRKEREVEKKMREDEISKVNRQHSDFF